MYPGLGIKYMVANSCNTWNTNVKLFYNNYINIFHENL